MLSASKLRKRKLKLHDEFLVRYIHGNARYLKCFASSLVEEEEAEYEPDDDEDEDLGGLMQLLMRRRYQSSGSVTKYALFLGQMGLLFKLNPLKYHGILTDGFLTFLAENFRDNIVFIVDNEGFLLYIMIMQTNQAERKKINEYISNNIDHLGKYQYMNTDYNPELEGFKLLDARLKPYEKTEDVVLTFF